VIYIKDAIEFYRKYGGKDITIEEKDQEEDDNTIEDEELASLLEF
jgi:hypothetical protein